MILLNRELRRLMDLYKARLNRSGDNRIDRIKNEQQRNFLKYLERTPNRKTIEIDNKEYHASILLKKDQQNNTDLHVLAPYGTPIKTGTLLRWENASWLVLYEVEPKKTSSFNGVIKKCNNILTWVDAHGIRRESPCYITGHSGTNLERRTSPSGRVNSNFVFPEYNANIDVILPNNLYTSALGNTAKFMLNKVAWELVNIDTLSSQDLVYVKLKQIFKSDVRDDEDNNLAGADRLGSWRVKIVDGARISLGISQTVPIEVLVYEKNNIVNKAQDLVWTVDKEEVVKINNKTITALATGTAKLRVALKNSPEVYDETEIVVEESPDLNVYYSLDGDSVIRQNQTKGYIVTKTVNGKEDTDVTFNFTLVDPNRITKGLKRTGKNSITIKAGSDKTGTVTLIARDDFWTEEIKISVDSMFA